MRNLILPAVLIAATASCQSAYYATMEKFGVDKREILVDRIAAVRGDQIEAKEQIQSTFEAFQELTNYDGGDLESIYKKLKGEYEDAEDEAGDVTDRIEKVEHVAGKLFAEWETEIGEMENASLASKSAELRRDAQTRYDGVITAMHSAEGKMAPVLKSFEDHVTFLKHNLNHDMISSLKGEAIAIEGNVADLIRSMQASIDEADSFLEKMKPAE